MALTVFTATDQAVGPVKVARRGSEIALAVSGDLSRGSVVVIEKRLDGDASYYTAMTLNSSNTPYIAEFQAVRGFTWRVRCSSFVTSDAPSAEIVIK